RLRRHQKHGRLFPHLVNYRRKLKNWASCQKPTRAKSGTSAVSISVVFTSLAGIEPLEDPEVLYVGRTNDVHRRMIEHKHQDLAIDEYVKKQFDVNDGKDLRIKWVQEETTITWNETIVDASQRNLAIGQNTISRIRTYDNPRPLQH
ncbi:hypothetical protein OS493_039413, partial [Desmophyllum pertusum]